MANNKDKIRAAAQKFLQKGQLDKAIREFERLVEDDPKDVRTLLKIGDLQTRCGNNPAATKTYEQVAQFYAEQGFFLKAVAVYKQILKIDPALISINLKLAELYHQLGLLTDATNQYRQISSLFEKEGRIEESIGVLRKMAELDPENVASRIKLAEMYARQNMVDQARAEFRAAATFLKTHRRMDDYVKVAERLVHIDPDDIETTRELAHIYVEKNDARRALAKLQVCFKVNPKDVDTLGLLANAFRELGQQAKTVSVYRELARIHLEAGDMAAHLDILQKIVEIDPSDVEARHALELNRRSQPVSRVQASQRKLELPSEVRQVDRRQRPPEPSPSAATASHGEEADLEDVDVDVDLDDEVGREPRPAVGQASKEGNETILRILTEADVYAKYGLKSKAAEHIRQVFSVDPHHREARLKLKDLLVDLHDEAAAVSELSVLVDEARGAGDLTAARDFAEEALGIAPDNPAARELLRKVSGEAPGPPAADLSEPSGDDEILVDSDELPDLVDEPESTGASAIGYEPSAAAAEIDLDAEILEGDDQPDDAPAVVSGMSVIPETRVRPSAVMGAKTPAIVNATTHSESGSSEVELTARPAPVPKPPVKAEAPAISRPALVDASEPVATKPKPAKPEVAKPEPTKTQAAKPEPVKAETAKPEPTSKPTAAKASGLDAELEALLSSAVPVRKKAAAPPPPTSRPAPLAKPAPTADSAATPVLAPEPGQAKPAPAAQPEFPPLTEEIGEVRFFVEQGLIDEAQDSLAGLLARYPKHPGLLALRTELGGALAGPAPDRASAAPPSDAAKPTAAGQSGATKAVPQPSQPAAKAVAPEPEIEPEPEVEPEPEPESIDDGSVDLAAELAGELTAAEPGDDDFQVSFADVFEEFKKGVAEQVEATDYETHYDLGIAYKEMGLLDDAIREFGIAQKSSERSIGALTMLGLCELELGNTARALEHFLKGLNHVSVKPEAAMALRFEIGAAYESMGRFGDAAKFFEKVHAMDTKFRDVAARLKEAQRLSAEEQQSVGNELDALLTETPAEKTSRQEKSDKISYV